MKTPIQLHELAEVRLALRRCRYGERCRRRLHKPAASIHDAAYVSRARPSRRQMLRASVGPKRRRGAAVFLANQRQPRSRRRDRRRFDTRPTADARTPRPRPADSAAGRFPGDNSRRASAPRHSERPPPRDSHSRDQLPRTIAAQLPSVESASYGDILTSPPGTLSASYNMRTGVTPMPCSRIRCIILCRRIHCPGDAV